MPNSWASSNVGASIIVSASSWNISFGETLKLRPVLPSCAHSRGLRDTPQAMGSLPRLQCQQYTAQSAKDQSNNNPLRSGRGLGAPSPQAVHQPMPATPGTSVPCLHAQCLLPTSTDWQDRTPH